MREENEIQLKRAYWQGVFDALNPVGKSRSDKSEKEKLTSAVWLTALDWILGQTEESASTIGKVEDKKK